MRLLRVAWLSLLFAGGVAIYVDLVHRPSTGMTDVPLLATLGAALITIAVTSMLNWAFKTAWDERAEFDGK